VEKYVYEIASSYTFATYAFRIDIIQGSGSFYFTRCQNIER